MRRLARMSMDRIAAVLASILLVVSACAPAAPPAAPTEAPSAAPTEEPRAGGRLVNGSFADAKVLNPVLTTDVPSATVSHRIHESLIGVDPKTAEPVPRLAERFDVSPDSTTLIFTLRDGLKWSDGSPLTGEDFKFTAEAVMRSKKTLSKNIFQDITGAKEFGEGQAETISGIKVDGRTITVQLAKPFCPALTEMGGFGIIPKSVFGKYMDPKDASKNIDDAPENTAPPLAMGPFKFKEWIPNDHITLVRNDNFFLGNALLDEWVYKVYPDATALAAALKTGEIDAAQVEPRDVEDLKRVDTLSFHSYLAPGYTYIGWNQLRGGKEFLQSKAVRQALTYGLNMDLVIERILFGLGQKMVAHTPPVSWAYDPVGLNDYKYDVEKAQQLLALDGWTKGSDGIYEKGGEKLEFEIVTNSGNKVREALLQVAVEQYKQIGINAIPRTESFEALVDRLDRSKDAKYGDQGGHDFDAVIIGWSLDPDPDAYSIWHSSQIGDGFNFVSYKSEVVDKALEDGRTKCAQADRKAAYKTFDKQLNEDQPYNFGFAPNINLFVNKKFQNVDPGPFGGPGTQGGDRYHWNIEKWWIK